MKRPPIGENRTKSNRYRNESNRGLRAQAGNSCGNLIYRCRGLLGKSRFQAEVIPVRDSVAPRLDSLAKALGADLIVVGTNQKGTLRRLCLGSVSRGVLRETLLSVACVPMMSNSITCSSPRQKYRSD